MTMRFPDESIESFDVLKFQGSMSRSLRVPKEMVFIQSIREGSVIVNAALLPTWIFEVPPNATETNSTSPTSPSSSLGFGLVGPAQASDDAPDSITFRSKDFDPTQRDYRTDTLRSLEMLLASHYLEGVGSFDYMLRTGSEYCDRLALDPDQMRGRMLSRCRNATADGDCGIVWGKELESVRRSLDPKVIPSRGFEGGLRSAMQQIYEGLGVGRLLPLVARSQQKSIEEAIATRSKADLNIDGMVVEVMGQVGNFSTPNCSMAYTCACNGVQETLQPYIRWRLLEKA